MNKVLFSLVAAIAACSVSFAQGPGQGPGRGEGRGPGQGQGQGRGEGQGQGRGQNQPVAIPDSILRESLKLTDEQMTKLTALKADVKVLMAVQLPAEALTELKLTADQKKSLTELGKQNQDKTRELMESRDREGMMAAREALVAEVAKILTADQKKVVAKYPQPRMGGRRGN
jgi:Spy/CpxP family protein refolding chaperone